MFAVQAECAAWFEALPESLRDSATAAALEAMIDLDLDASPRCGRRLAMAVTDCGATTFWPSVASRPGRVKSWVLAMLAPKWGLRVAPVPPQAAADLTRPGRNAGGMPGRDEGTGALIEPRNNRTQALWACRHDHPLPTVEDPMVGETEPRPAHRNSDSPLRDTTSVLQRDHGTHLARERTSPRG